MKTLSLFSGYGGLDLAVEEVLGATTAYVADIDKGACKILAHRFPDAPNLGDVSTVDYRSLGRIDVITGGFPCQDVSTAGKRAGMKDGTRSGLWSEMCRAIEELQPRYVIAENVRGLLSAEADSDVEPCPWCLGDDAGPSMRALGAVLADLADIGYDARWCGLRAADVGAPHGRFRVFILASPTDAGGETGIVGAGLRADEQTRDGRRLATRSDWAASPVALLPTPSASEGRKADNTPASVRKAGGHQVYLSSVVAEHLLPTPAVNDMGEGKTVEDWDAWTAKMRAKHGNGNGHGASLAIEAQRLLPTPRATDGTKGGPNQRGSSGDLMLPSAVHKLLPTPRSQNGEPRNQTIWARPLDQPQNLENALARQVWASTTPRGGEYAPAIARWEHLTRPAPAPAEPTGKGGAHRLSPRFTEWMMGLPDGWVTDVPGITRNEALKACGNGVVPAQAAAALGWLLSAQMGER
jgi:DNA (cytosine-5)-methyltransferase 1